MTKNVLVVAIVVLISVACSPLWAQNVSKECKVGEFTSINLQSVGNIVFTQSANYSCRLDGPSEYVEKTQVNVKGKTLVISYKQKQSDNIKNLTIYVSAPDLNKVKIDGVGNFDAKEALKLKNITFELDGVGSCNVKNLRCDDLKLDVNGVGNMKMNVDCRKINAKVNGVGNITLSGKADTAILRRNGVGDINNKKLKCENVSKSGWGF